MAIMFVFLGGFMGAFFNFLMRRNIDLGGSTKAFIMLELFVATAAVVILNPVRSNDYNWNTSIVLIGLVTGLLFGVLLWSQGKAVERGPPGLIFAIVNSASVFPGIVLAVLFGEPFGYIYTLWHAVGSLLVIVGLFWAGMQARRMRGASWLPYAFISFFSHVLMLSFIQWRALHLKSDLPPSEYLLSLTADQAACEWFLPMVFFGAAIVQTLVYTVRVHRLPTHQERVIGLVGGIASACSIFFLKQATEVASAWENALLFPLACVIVILLCNGWGQWLYDEKVNWKANALCVIGVLLGTANWQQLLIER